MKKRIMCIVSVIAMILTCIPGSVKAAAVSEKEAFANAAEITLPAEYDYELGSETYTDGYGEIQAHVSKVRLDAGKAIEVSFAASQEVTNLMISVYTEDENGNPYFLKRYYTSDRDSTYVDAIFQAKSAGTYYLEYSGEVTDNVMCHIEVTDIASLPYIEDQFEDTYEEITGLCDTEYVFGSEELYYNKSLNLAAYAKAFKFNAEAGDVVSAMCNSETGIDVMACLYEQNPDGEFVCTKYSDYNSGIKGGELAYFTINKSGTYYLVVCGRDIHQVGLCRLELDLSRKGTKMLDFTGTKKPEPDDSWTWDEESLTLTLKDGFYLSVNDDDAILIPDGTTIKVEGSAYIASYTNYAIEGENAFSIEGTSADAQLRLVGSNDGLYNMRRGAITIKDCDVAIRAQGYGIDSFSDLIITGSTLDIIAGARGMITYGEDNKITDSVLRINSIDEGIALESGDIVITESDIFVNSEGSYGIYNQMVNRKVDVSGGKLVIKSYESAVYGNKFTIANVLFDMQQYNARESRLLAVDELDGFKPDCDIRMYDIDGNLLYEGAWKESFIDGRDIRYEQTDVTRITSAHEHTWSDWEYDEEHHWRLCIADYCLSDDLGQNESMELHQFTTLDNGDRVCKCGYTIKADDTIKPGVDKEEEVPKDVKTGFGVTPVIWSIVIAGCALVAGVCVKKKSTL